MVQSISEKTDCSKTEQFFEEMPLKKLESYSFPYNPFKQLFLKFNMTIQTSTAEKAYFFVEKNTLKPKRARLSEKHFKMLVSKKN